MPSPASMTWTPASTHSRGLPPEDPISRRSPPRHLRRQSAEDRLAQGGWRSAPGSSRIVRDGPAANASRKPQAASRKRELQTEHDLPHVLVPLHPLMGLPDLLEEEHPVDDRLDRSR